MEYVCVITRLNFFNIKHNWHIFVYYQKVVLFPHIKYSHIISGEQIVSGFFHVMKSVQELIRNVIKIRLKNNGRVETMIPNWQRNW